MEENSGLYQKLLDASLNFVSFRPRSEKEIKAYLVKKLSRLSVIPAEAGIQLPILARVITRLRELDYVNDEKFAAWWVEQRQSHKPKGSRLIAQELKAKGVSVALTTTDEKGLAKRSVARKLVQWQHLPKFEQKKKIYGFLGRRGFDGETIHRVIDEVVAGRVQS